MLTLLLAFTLGLGQAISLSHDDGRSEGPNDYSELGSVAIKEMVRFEAPRRMRVTRLELVAEGAPAPIQVHFWHDIDSSVQPYIPFRRFEFDLVPPLTLRPRTPELGRWIGADLKSDLVLERGQRVFVGALLKGGSRFACDARLDKPGLSIVEAFDPKRPGNAQVRVLSSAGDFMVRLKGESVPEDDPVRLRPLHRLGGPAYSLAWGDVNGDGWEDLVIDGRRVVMNRAGRGFAAETRLEGESAFGLLGDFNGDGRLDLFRGTSDRKRPDSIWLNQASGGFRRAAILPAELLHGRSACALDYDGDSRLDLFVANGAALGDLVNADPSRLYQNQGSRFASVAEGAFGRGRTPPFGSSAAAADVDGRELPELFVGTYRLQADQLWSFSANGPRDLAPVQGIHLAPTPSGAMSGGHCLGAQWADFDRDGDLDLVVANLMHPDWRGFLGSCESLVHENRGPAGFRPRRLRDLGVSFEETPSNPLLVDLDNDGWLDLVHTSLYHSANLYMWRNGRWRDRTATAGLRAREATALAACDFDRDGRVDLAVADKAGGVVVLRNLSPRRSWVQLRLRGTGCVRQAAGAIARIRFAGRTLAEQVAVGRGLACQDSSWLHFGLGNSTGLASAEVAWPCGRRSRHRVSIPGPTIITEPPH